MTIEDKAKAYDEALKRAKKWLNAPNVDKIPTYGNRVIEEIFPELKESEDEKMRKGLIKFIKATQSNELWGEYSVFMTDALAWLEKQGKQMYDPRYSILDKLIEADDIYKMSVNDAMVEEARNKAIEALSKLEISKLLGIEKQDEQKNKINLYRLTFEDVLALECAMKTVKITEGSNELYEMLVRLYNKIHNAYLLEKQNERKSTDEVKQKFEVGDWVVDEDDNYVTQIERVIENVTNGKVAYDLVGGGYFPSTKKNYHLWTIQDAKDGDVLATEPIDSYQFPFVAIYKNRGLDFFNSYCFIGFDGKFYESETGHSIENIHPATKEQRELLFQKMKEAGYEWDSEKKKLKKIEPIDDYKGLTNFERAVADVCIGWIGKEPGWKQYIIDNADLLLKMAVKKFNSIQDTFIEPKPAYLEEFINELSKQFPDVSFAKLSRIAVRVAKWAKPAWSKEDEHRVNDTIYFLDTAKKHYASTIELDACIDWLKSIKERIKR